MQQQTLGNSLDPASYDIYTPYAKSRFHVMTKRGQANAGDAGGLLYGVGGRFVATQNV